MVYSRETDFRMEELAEYLMTNSKLGKNTAGWHGMDGVGIARHVLCCLIVMTVPKLQSESTPAGLPEGIM